MSKSCSTTRRPPQCLPPGHRARPNARLRYAGSRERSRNLGQLVPADPCRCANPQLGRPDERRAVPRPGQGPAPHGAVLHGFPGTEKNADLAQVVRRAGVNALIVHYRGAWGSEGNYSLSHVLEDVAATLRWLRQPAVADSYRVNTRRLILVGHSLGGFAALHGAVADSGVRAVAALAPGDFGRRGERLKDPQAFAASVRRLESQLGALRGTSGQALAQDMVDHATEWQLERYAHVLAGKRVLLVAATRDAVVPLGEVYEPLGAGLRQECARHLTV